MSSAGGTSSFQEKPAMDPKSSDHGSKKRKRKVHGNAPKKGEKGHLTATQLRNARKRRAKKKKKVLPQDPSQQYISNPLDTPVIRSANDFFRSLDTECSISVGPRKDWRTVARLAVRATKDHPVSVGLFAPNSHRLISVPDCPAHHSSINAAASTIEQICRRLGVKPFNETTGDGQLRHLALSVERSTGKVQITLVWNSTPTLESNDKEDPTLKALCSTIIASGSDRPKRKRRRGKKADAADKRVEPAAEAKKEFSLHSLWVHYNSSWKHANAIFSTEGGEKSWEHVFGPLSIVERLDLKDAGQQQGVPLRFPPNVFRQANIDAFTKIVAKIRRYIESFRFVGSSRLPPCVELYGGVGTIGLNVADLTSSLVSSDENPFNLDCFTASTSDLNEEIQQRISYQPKNASSMVNSKCLGGAQLVIVDPPRKGLDADVLEALCKTKGPQLLVYVSCGFDAFQRDCTALLGSRWKLDHVEGHVLFPGADAVETLAFFILK